MFKISRTLKNVLLFSFIFLAYNTEMINGAIFRVKKGRLDQWRAWCHELETSFREDALDSLRQEQIIQEAAFLFEIEGEYYVLGFMNGEGLPADMTKEVNIKHKQAKEECLERVSDITVLYNLQAQILGEKTKNMSAN